jgi:S-adenosylmethionine hydrolase
MTIDPARTNVRVKGIDLGPIRRTYGEVAVGARMALIGSEGMLELAVNQGSGAASMGLRLGDHVEVVISS